MNTNTLRGLRGCAAIVGCGAAIAMAWLGGDVTTSSRLQATIPDGQAIAVSTPPSTPAITKAVPTITGPAPLYAGEGPDTNPQSAGLPLP
jgi:hypothetical protein